MKDIKHLELFAGIGGFRRAIDLFADDRNVNSKCIGFSEIDSFASKSYKAIFNPYDEIEIGDIAKFTESRENIQMLPDFDFLTGGFPCQTFSMMGKQKGFNDQRGEVFYRIIDILKVKQPKYILLENVRNLQSHDNKRTFKEVIRSLTEDLNYKIDSVVLNTSDFGLPQTRRRLFIFGINNNLIEDDTQVSLDMNEILEETVTLNGNSSLNKYNDVLDGILNRNKVEEKYYLSDRIKPTILSNGSKNFKSKSEINQIIARPLTASMVKMHRACQDNYYSDEFLTAKDPYEFSQRDYNKEELAKHSIRKITPEEAFKLQGFNEVDLERAREAGVSNHQLYKQAGNAVSVNTVYGLLHYLNIKYDILNG